MSAEITALDDLLYQIAPGILRLERSADRLRLEPDRLARLLDSYKDAGVVEELLALICPECDQILEKNEESRFFCDLCDRYYSKTDVQKELVYEAKTPAAADQKHLAKAEMRKVKFTMPERVSSFDIARIQPWDEKLSPTAFTVPSSTLGDYEQERIWGYLEKYGICLFRMGAQSADDSVVYELAKFIGSPTEEQNLFKGKLKLIQPSVEGQANSGDTAKNLGLHVDGTQHERQPIALIFQYIMDAKLGAQSIFVDAEKVLLDIDDAPRRRILSDMARPDAAVFSKSGMTYQGPIFSISELGTIICRIRFDDVIQVHPDCLEHYEFLNERFNDQKYLLSFRPREGDVIVFDNWRVLHARDEVSGRRVRAHNRMWISEMKTNLRSQYSLGIRGLPAEEMAAIRSRNKGVIT